MKVLCFAPNDAIWRWSLPQALLLDALQQRGDEIVYVHCRREYARYCMAMASLGVAFSSPKEEKARICDVCERNTDAIRRELGFDQRELGSFIREDDRSTADRLSSELPLDAVVGTEVEGVPVGRFALYETVIQTKSITAQLAPEAERFYRAIFRNAYLSGKAAKRMLSEVGPDLGLCYHTAYAYNRTFQRVFESNGVPVWFLNASFNMAELDTHLAVARSDPEALFRKLLADWPKFADVACEPQHIGSAADHLVSLMRGGGFAYSKAISRAAESALTRLGCPAGKKIVLAMLSSYDELLASEVAGFGWSTRNDVFGSQCEWVEWLLEFARKREDIHLIIRVHPREFPVGGKGERSEHSYLLEAAFGKRPANVSINLPSDGIAIYDLLSEADAALVAWSSAGMEAGMLGLPVVTYAGDITLFPRSLALDATRREQYESLVCAAIGAGWSLERARGFWRWAVLMFVRTRIDLINGAPIPVRQSEWRKLSTRARNKLLDTVFPLGRERWSLKLRPWRLDDANRIYDLFDRRLEAFSDQDALHTSVSPEREMEAIRGELGRIASLIESMRGRPSVKLAHMLDRSLAA